MQHKDAERRLLALAALARSLLRNVLLQLAHGVLERRPRVVHLVDDEDVLADQVAHVQGGQVEPLRARHLCAGDFDGVGAEGFVEGEADGLDGDIGGASALEEGSVQRRQYVHMCEVGERGVRTSECARGRSRRRRWRP